MSNLADIVDGTKAATELAIQKAAQIAVKKATDYDIRSDINAIYIDASDVIFPAVFAVTLDAVKETTEAVSSATSIAIEVGIRDATEFKNYMATDDETRVAINIPHISFLGYMNGPVFNAIAEETSKLS